VLMLVTSFSLDVTPQGPDLPPRELNDPSRPSHLPYGNRRSHFPLPGLLRDSGFRAEFEVRELESHKGKRLKGGILGREW
jgi:hypothetical protein